MTTRELAAAAVAQSARHGYLDGSALASVFAWLRPNDLVWNYVINNYLLGKEPPAFDILYWNQDTVRLAAGLHRDFVRLALDNALAAARRLPGARLRRRSRPRSILRQLHRRGLGRSHRAVAQKRLPLDPAARRSDSRFVLSTSGHIQALINPPTFRTAVRAFGSRMSTRPDVREWESHAVIKSGSWWPDYSGWLASRSGQLKPKPEALGNRRYKPQAKAPGTYVHAS